MFVLYEERGLLFKNKQQAEYYLKNIGYYRLSPYTLPYQICQKEGCYDHAYQKNVYFEDVLNLYIFDRELRLLLLDALERIEISLRTQLDDALCLGKNSAHWYAEDCFKESVKRGKKILDAKTLHQEFLGVIEHLDKTKAILHYTKSYTSPKAPPSWMVFEALQLGQLIRLYESVEEKYVEPIIRNFRVSRRVFFNWLFVLRHLRNKCAHHARVWNADYPAIMIPHKKPRGFSFLGDIQGKHQGRLKQLGLILDVMTYMMSKVSGDTTWRSRVDTCIIKGCPKQFRSEMGLI